MADYNPDTMTNIGPLFRFEKFARDLIEGSVDRFLGARTALLDIAVRLGSVAEQSTRNGFAASNYVIRTHPLVLSEIAGETPDYGEKLLEFLRRLADEGQLIYEGQVDIVVVADEAVPVGEVDIVARHRYVMEEATAAMPARKAPTAPLELFDAYLVIDGRKHFPLKKTIVSIGRALDNDIVVEDASVSRKHAQIQLRSRRFVLFDLASRAGTKVNGQRVREYVLSSGDVISLGGALLIFGQEVDFAAEKKSSAASPGDVTQELSRGEGQ